MGTHRTRRAGYTDDLPSASGVRTIQRRIAVEAAALATPVLLAAAATVAYNYVRFGTTLGFPLEPFETFSTPLP